MSLDYGDPVEEFQRVYDLGDDELLEEDQLTAPGVFEGEREFIHFAEGDYETDKHWAFEVKAEECALIVVDMQQDFVDPANPMCVPQAYRQVPRIKALIEGCRKANVPVFYTEHHIGSDCAADFYEYWDPIAAGAIKEGEEDTKVYRGLDPRPEERIINVKHTYDSFAGTDLDYVLRNRGVKTVIICGTLTNYCCESTARTAYFLNYHVVFGSDVNATDNALAHEGTVRTLRRGFARILDHKAIIRILEDGDDVYAEAKADRERQRAAPRQEVGIAT